MRRYEAVEYRPPDHQTDVEVVDRGHPSAHRVVTAYRVGGRKIVAAIFLDLRSHRAQLIVNRGQVGPFAHRGLDQSAHVVGDLGVSENVGKRVFWSGVAESHRVIQCDLAVSDGVARLNQAQLR